jgi:GntR family transcriptional repressor for pyruvate dehydrogenase complex
MVKPFPPAARRNRADGALVRLRRDLLTGRYSPGDRLPPERELAVRFGTNRNTLREALRTLESENLVRGRQGDGTIVLDWRRNGEINLLPAFLAEETPVGERVDAVASLLRLRTMLIDEAILLAVQRQDSEDHVALQGALDELRKLPTGTEAVEADVAFYRALVLASRNLVIIWVFNTFARIFLELGTKFPMLWRIDADYAHAVGRVVGFIGTGRPGEARAEMRKLFDERTAAILDLLHGSPDAKRIRELLEGATGQGSAGKRRRKAAP